MADPSASPSLDEEAETQWLARVIAAPDAWRSRGATAGGLLGAATAATLAVALNSPSLEEKLVLKITVGASLALFVLAVTLFLIASVYPSPKVSEAETTNYAASIESYCTSESRPIRCLVISGTVSAVLAVAATLAAAGITFLQPSDEWKQVRVIGGSDRQALVAACPKLQDAVLGQVEGGGDKPLELKLRRGVCGDAGVSFKLDDPDLSILISDVP